MWRVVALLPLAACLDLDWPTLEGTYEGRNEFPGVAPPIWTFTISERGPSNAPCDQFICDPSEGVSGDWAITGIGTGTFYGTSSGSSLQLFLDVEHFGHCKYRVNGEVAPEYAQISGTYDSDCLFHGNLVLNRKDD